MRKLSMKWFWILFVCCVASVTPCVIERKPRNIICYYTNGINITPPESFNTKLCTHMNYAFIKLDANGLLILNKKYTDNEKMIYKKVSSLKAANPNLKLLISLGDTPASQFAAIAADPIKRQNLVNSSVKFLENYGFDGVDVDWEKPSLKDKDNFIDLLKEMKEAFDENNWLLTVAVFPYPYDGYNVTEISKYVDLIHLMCYNFYGPWSAYTGHNAALYSSPIESSYEKRRLNTNMCLQNWLDAGAPKEKINVGIPFYGRTFTLVNPADHTLHSPIHGAGKPSTPAYKQICLNFNNYTQVWDEEQKVNYKYYNDQWLSYEDERSIKEKAKYIKNHGVIGAMIWQIGQDDVNGDCGTKQGLLQIINQYLL